MGRSVGVAMAAAAAVVEVVEVVEVAEALIVRAVGLAFVRAFLYLL